jgi:hypothetical protein
MAPDQAPPIVDAKCCKTCVSFDNPSIGHGRCMKRPTTHRTEYGAPRVLVDASNICDWYEAAQPDGSGRKTR